jgi:hypothetical protein
MAMMERGEIGASIDAAMGMVSFQADLDRASSLVLLSRLEKQMQVTFGIIRAAAIGARVPNLIYFFLLLLSHVTRLWCQAVTVVVLYRLLTSSTRSFVRSTRLFHAAIVTYPR